MYWSMWTPFAAGLPGTFMISVHLVQCHIDFIRSSSEFQGLQSQCISLYRAQKVVNSNLEFYKISKDSKTYSDTHLATYVGICHQIGHYCLRSISSKKAMGLSLETVVLIFMDVHEDFAQCFQGLMVDLGTQLALQQLAILACQNVPPY